MSRYSEACDAGYDGPSPSEERRMAARERNMALDCSDPAHNGCPSCDEEFGEEE